MASCVATKSDLRAYDDAAAEKQHKIAIATAQLHVGEITPGQYLNAVDATAAETSAVVDNVGENWVMIGTTILSALGVGLHVAGSSKVGKAGDVLVSTLSDVIALFPNPFSKSVKPTTPPSTPSVPAT